MKRWSAVHTRLYRLTRGLIGKRLVGNDMLLLTTIGYVSGEPHTVPLLYLRDDDQLVIAASHGGRHKNPNWYENLVANPNVVVQVKGERKPMSARTATTEERAIWWPRIEAAYPGYAVYQSRTERVIPLVLLATQLPG